MKWCMTGGACLFLLVSLWLSGVEGQDKKKDKQVEPRITLVLPLGVPAGQTSKITVRGIKLDEAKDLRLVAGKGTAKILSKGKTGVPDKSLEHLGDTQVVAELTLQAGLPSDPVALVVVLPEGETKPHALLVDTALPVIKEKEPNDGFKQALPVTLPSVIEGLIERPRDVDVFRFAGKAGMKVSFEVLAARHGSPLDSILTLYNAARIQIAQSDDLKDTVDSRLEATLPADGDYFLVLQDAHDSGSSLHAYRLQCTGR